MTQALFPNNKSKHGATNMQELKYLFFYTFFQLLKLNFKGGPEIST